METTATNPLSRMAESLPVAALRGASIAARIFGAGMALLIALDQTYDPTQVFTVITAVAILLSLAPLTGSVGDLAAALGAGVVFFAGSVLTHFEPGITMLAMGLLGGLAAFAFAYRSGRDAMLPAVVFVAAALITAPLQAAIVLAFE